MTAQSPDDQAREFHFTEDEWRQYQQMPEQGYSHRLYLEGVFNRWYRDQFALNPPPGWYMFGTHIDTPGPLEFWGQDEGGTPIWERPTEPTDAEVEAVLLQLNALDPGHWNFNMAESVARAARGAQ